MFSDSGINWLLVVCRLLEKKDRKKDEGILKMIVLNILGRYFPILGHRHRGLGILWWPVHS